MRAAKIGRVLQKERFLKKGKETQQSGLADGDNKKTRRDRIET